MLMGAVTNAAGALNGAYSVGDLVLINDVRPIDPRLLGRRRLEIAAYQSRRTFREPSPSWNQRG
jgi:hypothetical protein